MSGGVKPCLKYNTFKMSEGSWWNFLKYFGLIKASCQAYWIHLINFEQSMTPVTISCCLLLLWIFHCYHILYLIDTLKVSYRKLNHWGAVTHICVSKLASIVSDNGLSPGRHQAITETDAGMFLFGPLATNFSEILIKIHIFLFKKIQLEILSGIWRPFCLGLNLIR